jgi:hypothetical protein
MRRHLTYANVMATIAAFGVLAGGSAYAVSKIDTPDLANKAVTAKKLDTNAVTSKKVAAGAVESGDLAGRVQGVALAGAKIASDGTVISWFNRLGGAPVVQHAGVGVYRFGWPGTGVVNLYCSVQIATVETSLGGEAAAGVDVPHGGPAQPQVIVRDSSGNPVDRSFNYVLFGSADDQAACLN